jgi:hypothetical protein
MAERTAWKQGLMVGLIGAVTVAVWFFILDMVRGRPFFTPAALGSTVFLGVRDLDSVQVTVGIILGYSAVHLAAFILLGTLVVVIARRARTTPPLILGALLVFVTFQALFMGVLAIAAEHLLGALAWWGVAIGNLLAAVTMGYYVWEKDPALKQALEQEPFDRTH